MKSCGKNIFQKLFIFCFVFLFFMVGCGGGGSPSSSGNNISQSGAVKGTVIAASDISFKGHPEVQQIVLQNTTGVSGAICNVEETDKTATTNQTGFFSITDIPAGSYILICQKTGTDGKVYASMMPVTVQNGQTVDLATIQITLSGSIQGKATLTGQTDNTGISIYIPRTTMQATTDLSGTYLIGNVPEGTYELRFEKNGYVTVKQLGLLVAAGQTATATDVILNLSTGVSGSITIENGAANATSRTVNISVTASANATRMMISEDPDFVGATWQPVSATTWTFSSDGAKRLYIKFSDANGLESAPLSDTIIINTTTPIDQCNGVDVTGLCITVDSIVPTDTMTGFGDTSDVDAFQAADCDGDPNTNDPEPFGKHSAKVTISAKLMNGETSPPAPAFVTFTGYTVQYVASTTNAVVAPALTAQAFADSWKVNADETVTRTLELVPVQTKEEYVNGGGGVTPAIYTVNYTIRGTSQFNEDVVLIGSTSINIGNFNNCH